MYKNSVLLDFSRGTATKQFNDLAAAGDLLMKILSGVTHKNKPKEKH